MSEDCIRWVHDLHHRANRSTILGASLVVAPDRYTKLSRLDPDDGQVIWVADVHKPWGTFAGNEKICAYLNQHSFLECFDTITGTAVWSVELSERWPDVYSHVLVVDDAAVTSGWRNWRCRYATATSRG